MIRFGQEVVSFRRTCRSEKCATARYPVRDRIYPGFLPVPKIRDISQVKGFGNPGNLTSLFLKCESARKAGPDEVDPESMYITNKCFTFQLVFNRTVLLREDAGK